MYVTILWNALHPYTSLILCRYFLFHDNNVDEETKGKKREVRTINRNFINKTTRRLVKTIKKYPYYVFIYSHNKRKQPQI